MVLAHFVACGVSRLARYNVTAETLSGDDGKVKYFEGTPIPTSIVLVGLLALAAAQGPWALTCGAARWCWRASRCTRWCCCLRRPAR